MISDTGTSEIMGKRSAIAGIFYVHRLNVALCKHLTGSIFRSLDYFGAGRGYFKA